MQIETKDLLNFLGVEAENIDAFKEKFENEFTRNSNINKDHPKVKAFVGETLGILEKNLKNIAKNHNAEWGGGDWDSKTLNDKFSFAMGKVVENHNAILEDFKKTHTGDAEAVKEWENKVKVLSSKLTDTETLLGHTKNEFENYKQTESQKEKQRIINEHTTAAIGKIKFKPGVNDLTKKGFITSFSENYKLELDENKTPFVTDIKGQRIPNPKTTGTFMSLEDVLLHEAIKADVYEKNPHAQQQQRTGTQTYTPPIEQTNGRVLNSSAAKAAV